MPSSNGNNYLLILYDYDSNHIFAQPFKNRTAKCLLTAYQVLHTRLCKAGLKPQLQRLDNQCSELLKTFMHKQDIDFQLVPPGIHRRNAAERGICTFKNHFIAGLCSVDKEFPIHLWDRLLPQAEITLNLLHGSRINPKLSAWVQVHGTFDYNRTPLGPPGCRVLAHEKPEKRTTWSPHGLDGWYVGPALDSYRCYKIWIWETRSICTCDTVTWFPTKVTIPPSSSTDLILASLQDIADALKNPAPRSPLAPRTNAQATALQTLVDVLTNQLNNDEPVPTVTAPALRVPATQALAPMAPVQRVSMPQAIPDLHLIPANPDDAAPIAPTPQPALITPTLPQPDEALPTPERAPPRRPTRAHV
jgi:hypothetical protein